MPEVRVVATAGHVDHGKSSLIVRLTGMDPDRWEEEKRRGLTIDLGYAWCTLPSGREVGFVDVPGHERFVGNMLAGVGPVGLILFVVAADEGWEPQSEEHLAILDALGAARGVIALTKRDLVDDATLQLARDEITGRVHGTVLESAPVLPVSARTGEGIAELTAGIDAMVRAAPVPEVTRARLFVDRVFTMKGAGTVVTGTLAGGCLALGDDVECYPRGGHARVRSLQTHKRTEARACATVRVAANLAGVDRAQLRRGDVVGHPGEWPTTQVVEGSLRPVRGITHAISARGAFKLYAGSVEVDARIRLYGASRLESGEEQFVRIRLQRPVVLDVFDRFVLRDMGRRETVAGGTILDIAPPARPGAEATARLAIRRDAERDDLPGLLAEERGAVRAADAARITGSAAVPAGRIGDWFLGPRIASETGVALAAALGLHHRDHPLEEGADLATAREAIGRALRSAHAPTDADLVEALLEEAGAAGIVVRSAGIVRLPDHRVVLEERSADLDRLVAAVSGEDSATPPTVSRLQEMGIGRDVIEAAARAGAVVRISAELVFAPEQIARAQALIDAAAAGITVSTFRGSLGTTRKYAVPLLEWFDQRGLTRREGDLRFPRGAPS